MGLARIKIAVCETPGASERCEMQKNLNIQPLVSPPYLSPSLSFSLTYHLYFSEPGKMSINLKVYPVK